MGTLEEKLQRMILNKYGTVLNFSKSIGLPNSTVVGVLKRGVHNSGVDNVVIICNALEISIDALAEGLIIPKIETVKIDGERDIAKIYIALMKRLATEDGIVVDGEPITPAERFTLYDSLELDLEKIRRLHERERKGS